MALLSKWVSDSAMLLEVIDVTQQKQLATTQRILSISYRIYGCIPSIIAAQIAPVAQLMLFKWTM